MVDRAGQQTLEGRHVAPLAEIRSAAQPSWAAANVVVTRWLVKRDHPEISPSGKAGPPALCEWKGLRASEYLASQQFDLGQFLP
jgi:hypothetical protein